MSKQKREYTTESEQKAVELSYARGQRRKGMWGTGTESLGIGSLAQGGQKIWGEQFSRKREPQTYRWTKGDSGTKEKTGGRGDQTRYPKKGDSHPCLPALLN